MKVGVVVGLLRKASMFQERRLVNPKKKYMSPKRGSVFTLALW